VVVREVIFVDFESRSRIKLPDVGAWRYAEDETTEILFLGWKVKGSEERNLWVPPVTCKILGIDCMPFPQKILDHIAKDGVFESHGVQFERSMWIHQLNKRFGIPIPTKWRDSMAACAYKAVPLKLEHAGKALGLQELKDDRGKYLINQLTGYKGPTKKQPDRIYREEPDLMHEFGEYCKQDTVSEECLSDDLGDLPPTEQRIWVMDQIINQRGVKIDVEAIKAGFRIIECLEGELEVELASITGDEVTTGNQVAKMKKWLLTEDVAAPNLQAETVEELVKTKGISKKAKRVLEIRAALSKSSTKKLTRMIQSVNRDGRLRGLLQYHGAGTGRWAGRGAQPHNLPRGSLEKYCEMMFGKGNASYENMVATMEYLIDCIKIADCEDNTQKAIDTLKFAFGDVMEAISTAIRGMFCAEEDSNLMVADFAAIEAVVTAWVAGEEWKLEAFRSINSGEKYKGADDIYCATAAEIFNRPVSKKTDPDGRQIGKVCELAFGYQGGIGAWRKFDSSDRYSDDEVNEFKTSWRDKHPATVALWKGLEYAAIQTVKTGKPNSYRTITFELVVENGKNWLTCVLPNGKKIWYLDPVVTRELLPWDTDGTKFGDKLSYMGRDNKKNGIWGRVFTYGGMLTENVVQAISREIMVEAMIRVERLGYEILLTVHDEIIAEVKKIFGSLTQFCAEMKAELPWLPGCPINVAGWIGPRYMKA
jgi:DNA polymerase